MVDNSKRIDELKRELAKDPRSRQFYQLGELLRREGRLGEAAEVLRGGLRHHTRYVAAWVALGRTCLDLGHGRESEAADALTQALGLDAQNPVAWRLLGESRLACGQRPAALEAMERALALVPGDEVLKAAVEALQVEVAKTAPLLVPPPVSAPRPADTPPAAVAAPLPEPAPEEAPFDFDAAPLALEPSVAHPPLAEAVLPPGPEGGEVPGSAISAGEHIEPAAPPAEALGAAVAADQPSPAAAPLAASAVPPGEVFDVFGEPAHAAEPVVEAQTVAAPAEEVAAPAPAAPTAEPEPGVAAVAEMEGGPPDAAVAPEAAEPPVPPLAPVEEPPPPPVVAVPAEPPVPPVTLVEEPPPPSLVAVPAEPPVAPADAEPPASLTLARLYLRQQQPGAAVDVLETLLRREPDNQEAGELLGLVRDMLDVAPAVTTPTLTPGERRIASLQRWLARVQAGRERIAP